MCTKGNKVIGQGLAGQTEGHVVEAHIEVIEIGPRKGVQYHPRTIPASKKVKLVRMLFDAGFDRIEVTSFVHPKVVPQMKDAIEVMQGIQDVHRRPERETASQVLVPNETGCREAIASRADEIVVWIFLTDELNQITHNRSRAETLKEINTIIGIAQTNRIPVSAYIGGAFGYPGMDSLHYDDVKGMVDKLLHLGIRQVCLNDEFCIANPRMMQDYFRTYLRDIDRSRLAVHFHDNLGLGLANAFAAYEEGVRTFKTSLGGAGIHSDLKLASKGKAFNQTQSPNIPTEDLVYVFEKMGVSTGIDVDRLIECGRTMEDILESRQASRVLARGLSQRTLKQAARLTEIA